MIPLLVNPFSGSGRTLQRVEALAQMLTSRHGMPSQIIDTLDARRALLADPDLPRRCPCLVVAGGDGTIASVVNELHPDTLGQLPIAIVAAGNENLLARELGLRTLSPDALAAAIMQGTTRTIQLGVAGTRRFMLMVSAGLDSQVVRQVEAWRVQPDGLKRATRLSYARPILSALVRYDYPSLELQPDDGPAIPGTHALVFNINRYAGGLGFAPDATGQDGLLHYIVFEKPGPFQAMRYLTLTAMGRHHTRHDVKTGSARRLALRAPRPLPVQADGDTIGQTPLDITLHTATLKLILPSQAIH